MLYYPNSQFHFFWGYCWILKFKGVTRISTDPSTIERTWIEHKISRSCSTIQDKISTSTQSSQEGRGWTSLLFWFSEMKPDHFSGATLMYMLAWESIISQISSTILVSNLVSYELIEPKFWGSLVLICLHLVSKFHLDWSKRTPRRDWKLFPGPSQCICYLYSLWKCIFKIFCSRFPLGLLPSNLPPPFTIFCKLVQFQIFLRITPADIQLLYLFLR